MCKRDKRSHYRYKEDMIEEMAAFGSRLHVTLNISIHRVIAQSTKMSSTHSIAMSSFTPAKMLKYFLLYYYLIREYKLNFIIAL